MNTRRICEMKVVTPSFMLYDLQKTESYFPLPYRPYLVNADSDREILQMYVREKQYCEQTW